MANQIPIDIIALKGWQLRYALATYVGDLETTDTPSLRFTHGEPFSVMEMVDRPAYRLEDGSVIEGKRVKKKEPRALRSDELRSILDKYDIPVEEVGIDFVYTVDGRTFKDIFQDEAKARAIIAMVTKQESVLVPDL
ncbi:MULTISPECIES: hypothetical protein [Pseudomonas]|uniref:hypothetical protein n=1 Tax=Pseudomonas TaxID=286 RepID=UPI00093F069D|nr:MULTISPECIES: hypothetical protein [Pseudomonas]OKO50356.1 hypothetical protein BMH52_01315 [Pseudomonas sp. BTN1]GLH47664.1 hypothetical protein RS3R2_13450 [Pseudomonas lactis]